MSAIESGLKETRTFAPPTSFQEAARIGDMETYRRMHEQSVKDPEGFFDGVAKELPWIEPYSKVLDWSGKPYAKWFVGGKLNASAVCLDQHVEGGRAGKTAILWEGEPGDVQSFTYAELLREVSRFANGLKKRGVKKGDRVAIYMPMIPELAFAVLACARIGAIHSVIFGGFSANSIRDRVEDGGCTAVITADGGWRRGKVLPLKQVVDEALVGIDSVHTVFTVCRTENECMWQEELVHLQQFLTFTRSPVQLTSWDIWSASFVRAETALHRGTTGYSDPIFYRNVLSFLDRTDAPETARATVDLLRGYSTGNWDRAAAGADILVERVGRGEAWVTPDLLLDIAVLAYLETDRPEAASGAYEALVTSTGRADWNLRNRLLRAMIDDRLGVD